ncbi:hypothetical protein L6272_06015, partial [Microgenomates group bacterium]|nr:hypothetical protein [Microgenomates group bacterium]
MALNAVDISPNFSPESLKLLADTLLLAAKQKQLLALPNHLALVLNRLPQITTILTRLGRTDLRLKPPQSSSAKLDKVSFSPDLKKIIYLSFAESLILNSPLVEPTHFLIPLNDCLEEPLDKKDIRQAILNQLPSQPQSKTSDQLPTLKQFSENLTQKALTAKLDPVIGREKEIEQLIRVLARRTKSNAILVGDPGVGKTAIVEGLALKIAQNQVPDILKNIQIFNLNLTTLLAG